MRGLTHHCFPCLAKLTHYTIELATADENLRVQLAQQIAKLIAADFSSQTVPAHLGSRIQKTIRKATGTDPYAVIKVADNQTAAKIISTIEPENLDLKELVQLAIIGNVIDSALFRSAVELQHLEKVLAEETIVLSEFKRFTDILEQAESILYLTDNCGEILFDRLLIERLNQQGKKIYLSPKSEPTCNDATVNEIREYGLDQFAVAVVPASSTMGLNFEECSAEFLDVWESADLIISKGMGHYEALWGRPEKIAYLFKAKCLPVANNAGVPLNTNLLRLSSSCYA